MDELALLKEYRLDDAAPAQAREQVRAALQQKLRARSRRRRTVAVVAFAAAAVLAGAAYGVVRELIVGEPAPPEVRQQPAHFGHSAELIPVPHPEDPQLAKARVGAILDSSVGRVYLFTSPNAGGRCVSTWIEGDRGYQGRLNMNTTCGAPSQSFYMVGKQQYHGKQVQLLAGRAGDGVARVALIFGSKTVDVPLSGRSFLAEIHAWPNLLLTYARNGTVLERQPIARPAFHGLPARHPHQVTRARQVAQIKARNGTEQIRLLVARASDGGYCQIVRSDAFASNRGCSIPRPHPNEIAVAAVNYGGAPGGILLLVGPVGSNVASLELRYQDGRQVTVPLHEGWVLYEIEPRDYVNGRRPTIVIAHDEAGRKVASERLPWDR